MSGAAVLLNPRLLVRCLGFRAPGALRHYWLLVLSVVLIQWDHYSTFRKARQVFSFDRSNISDIVRPVEGKIIDWLLVLLLNRI